MPRDIDLEALRRIAAMAKGRVGDKQPVGVATTKEEVDIGKVLTFKILPGPVDAPPTYEAFVRLPPFTIVRARGRLPGRPSCARLTSTKPDHFQLACLSTIRHRGWSFNGGSLIQVNVVRHTNPAGCPERQADELAAWELLKYGVSLAKVPLTTTGSFYEWAVVREN